MMDVKYYISYVSSESVESLLEIFNNGGNVSGLLEFSSEYLNDIDTFISLNIENNEGFVFLCEVPVDFQSDFINKEYFVGAKRLSTGTWFDNPESITYGGPSKIENKEQLNRWILFNRKRFIQYAYAKIKLVKKVEKDYGKNQSFGLKG